MCDLETLTESGGDSGHRNLHVPKGREAGKSRLILGIQLGSLGHGGVQEECLERVFRLSHRQRARLTCLSVSSPVKGDNSGSGCLVGCWEDSVR